MLENGVEQRPQIGRGMLPVQRGGAGAAGREHDGAVQLLVGGVQLEQQLQRFVHNLGAARVRAIHLVDHDNDRQIQLQRLFEHEAGLRHGAFKGIDQQQHAVDHLQHALDLAGKVGVAGGVDDVDLNALVVDGSVLGQYGDAALALQIIGVHHALGHLLIFAENAALLEHFVHQRGLAMIDVRDDGYISEIFSFHSQSQRLLRLSRLLQ